MVVRKEVELDVRTSIQIVVRPITASIHEDFSSKSLLNKSANTLSSAVLIVCFNVLFYPISELESIYGFNLSDKRNLWRSCRRSPIMQVSRSATKTLNLRNVFQFRLRKAPISMNVTSVELTRKQLYDRVWKTPMRTLAKEFGLSDVGLAKICRKHNIPRPPVSQRDPAELKSLRNKINVWQNLTAPNLE